MVTVTNSNNCTVSASVSVTVNSLPTVSAGNDTTIQAGGTATLTASGANTYVWSNSQSTTSIAVSPTITTTYTVTGTDAHGCTASQAVTVFIGTTSQAPVAGFVVSAQNVPCPNQISFIDTSTNVPTSWLWVFYGNCVSPDSSIQQNPQNVLYNQHGIYTVKLTASNANGSNSHISSVTITGNCDCNGNVGIIEASGLTNITLKPNPSSGNFTLSFETDKPEEIQIKIFDAIGQLIKEEAPVKVSGTYTKEINLGNVAKGIYILQLKAGANMVNQKIEVN